MTSVLHYIEKLPKKEREQVKRYAGITLLMPASSLKEALGKAFPFCMTEEGPQFWKSVIEKYGTDKETE